mgnify:CR=1 FL=1
MKLDRRTVITGIGAAGLLSIVPIFAQSPSQPQPFTRLWQYPFCGYDGKPMRARATIQTGPISLDDVKIVQEEFDRRESDIRTLFENLYRQQRTNEGMDKAEKDFQTVFDEINKAITNRAGRGIDVVVTPVPFADDTSLRCSLSHLR